MPAYGELWLSFCLIVATNQVQDINTHSLNALALNLWVICALVQSDFELIPKLNWAVNVGGESRRWRDEAEGDMRSAVLVARRFFFLRFVPHYRSNTNHRLSHTMLSENVDCLQVKTRLLQSYHHILHLIWSVFKTIKKSRIWRIYRSHQIYLSCVRFLIYLCLIGLDFSR